MHLKLFTWGAVSRIKTSRERETKRRKSKIQENNRDRKTKSICIFGRFNRHVTSVTLRQWDLLEFRAYRCCRLWLFLQGARLSVALVSSSSIRALIMGVRATSCALQLASRWPTPCSCSLPWSHSDGDVHLKKALNVSEPSHCSPVGGENPPAERHVKQMHLQLAAGGSAECPPADWNLVWSAGGQGDFLRVISGSALLPLLGDSSRSGWWKSLQTRGGGGHVEVSTRSSEGAESIRGDRMCLGFHGNSLGQTTSK